MNYYIKFISLALVSIFLYPLAEGIMWILPANSRKCIKDELRQNVLVTGDLMVSEIPGQIVSYEIRDSKNHILSQKDNVVKEKFSFSVEHFDTCEICFQSRVTNYQREGLPHEVSLILQHGAEAKNYEGMADVAKLKPLELELRKLEDLSKAIVDDFKEMKLREEQLRDTNESTNNRVLYFSIFSMICLLGLATWQVLYLRRFFKAKKLIE